ncbi:GMC oxidoreductase-domain-containing protein [Lipomyces starkeyi]
MIRDPEVIQGAMTAYMTSREGPLTSGFHSAASIPVVECLTEPGRSELLKVLDEHLNTTSNPKAPSQELQYASIRSILENPAEASAVMAMGATQFHFDKETHKDIFSISDPSSHAVQWVPTLVGTKQLADDVKPNGAVLPKGTDHVKRNTVTFNHPCGTGAMMSFDLGGVVDDRLRVYGVNGLRVVDASVFTMIPKGFIQSSVYAVAEKAADLIKEDYS